MTILKAFIHYCYVRHAMAGTSEVFLTQSSRVKKPGQRHSHGQREPSAPLHCSSAGDAGRPFSIRSQRMRNV